MPDQEQDNQPATRGDLRELGSRMSAERAEMESRLIEAMRDMQTEVLRAFHGWARPMEIRVRGIMSTTLGFEERLALLEERVARLDLPEPPQPPADPS